MSSSSQNREPGVDPARDEFDEITRGVPVVSAWQALWNDAEDVLYATRPEGFEVEDIGRLAFSRLPESERLRALDVLFYTYWAALQADRETRAAIDGGAS